MYNQQYATSESGAMEIAKEIKQRVTKAASEGLSQIACGSVSKHPRGRSISSQSQISESSLTSTLSNFTDFVLPPTHHAISAPVIPVVSQEQVVIKELLYCLIGVGGNYIVPFECNVDGNMTIKFNISDKIQASLRDILQDILPLAGFYYAVHKSVYLSSSIESGLVMNAFSSSLRSLINDYYLSLVQLESEYRERSLSLQKLMFFVRPTMHIFEMLAEITHQIDKYDDMYGAALLTFLYNKITSLTGDVSSQQIIIHLTKMTAIPYINMLRLWMLKGVIIDPRDEFMVKDNEIMHRENANFDHYSAEYWEKRYTLRRDKTPKFLQPFSDCILRTGKYLNVIRQCIEHNNANDNEELIFSPDNLTTLTCFIEKAYKGASERLLKVLVKDNDLMGHLMSVKKYLLLQQGDFINQFMDASDRELSKNVDKILPMKLENLLGLTLRVTSTKFDEYKDDLHCQLFPFELVKQMEKIHLAGCSYDDYWHGDKINLTGLECFAFRYDVKWPISLILNHYAIIQYQMLFRQLFYCKHVERQLCKVWKDNNNTKKFSPQTAELYRSAFILRQRMMSAIQNIEYYMMIEVIEPAWLEFVAKIEKVNDVDDVLLIHQDFLEICLYNCMLKNPELLRSVVKLCNICLSFCKFMQRAQQYFIDAELTSMLRSDDSNDSDSDVELLSHMQQSESSLAPTETFSERIKRFDLEFTFQLIGLMKQINDTAFDTHSSKLVNLVHRINFNSFYKHQLEQISCVNENDSNISL